MYGRYPFHKVNLVRTKNPVDSFFEMEELGTVVPARCPSHRDCTKCSPQAEMFTRREQEELRLIRAGMRLDENEKIIHVTYPYVKDPAVLPDNQNQVIAIANGVGVETEEAWTPGGLQQGAPKSH